MTGISDTEAERVLANFLQRGLIKLRHDDLEEAYAMRNEVAILAYGSLQTDPGWEIAPLIEHRRRRAPELPKNAESVEVCRTSKCVRLESETRSSQEQ
jgi:hypothetical protein